MRIVFFGASELGWECCQTLFALGQEVVGIFSIPQEFKISWSTTPVKNVRFKSFEDLAATHSVPLIYCTKKMSDTEYQRAIGELQPDLLVVIGWYYMVPHVLRSLAPLGAVAIHASLLPQYRGGAPLVWAIINGESQAGVSLFYLDDGVDDGDLIGQASFNISIEENIADVVGKSMNAAVQLVRDYVPMLATGNAPRLPQDHTQATVVPQRKPEDGLIDWTSKSALQAYNWIRAQTHPYPGAFTYLNHEKLIIWKASILNAVNKGNTQPGEIVLTVPEEPNAFGVYCAEGQLLLVHEVGLDDGSVMSGADYIITRRVRTSMILGYPEEIAGRKH